MGAEHSHREQERRRGYKYDSKIHRAHYHPLPEYACSIRGAFVFVKGENGGTNYSFKERGLFLGFSDAQASDLNVFGFLVNANKRKALKGGGLTR